MNWYPKNKSRIVQVEVSGHFCQIWLARLLFVLSLQMIWTNQIELGSWIMLISTALFALSAFKRGFTPLAIIPILASIQLIFAFVILSKDRFAWLNYSPLNAWEYLDYAAFGVACYIFPFLFLPLNFPILDESSTRGNLYRPILRGMLLWGGGANLLLFIFEEVPIVGPLLWYASLLWKLAIPIAFFDLGKKRLSLMLLGTLATICFFSSLYWDLLVVVLLGVAYGFSLQRINRLTLFVILAFGSFGILSIQTFKHVQRSSSDYDTISELTEIGYAFRDEEERDLLISEVLGRLNQGVNDAFVYARCKEQECSSNSIFKSAIGVFLPRFLFPYKPKFNSDKLRELGGYSGMGSSFMTISGCAEAFENFGQLFGGLFLLVFSSGLLMFHHLLQRQFPSFPQIILLLPFYHVIRVEVDFYHWFTSLAYGYFVLLAFSWYVHRNYAQQGN